MGFNTNYNTTVGSKSNFVGVPYQFGVNTIMAHLNTGYYHVHGASFVYPKYADPIELESSDDEWSTTGDIVEVIPANTFNHAFDLHWCSVSDISANLYGIIDIFSGEVGSEVIIGSIDVVRNVSASREMAMPVQVPQQSKENRISCRFSDSTGSSRSVKVRFYGHTYGTTL